MGNLPFRFHHSHAMKTFEFPPKKGNKHLRWLFIGRSIIAGVDVANGNRQMQCSNGMNEAN